ncbi:Rho GTPase activation protein [Cordyceps fumosorosea ARSEF 2679]|uniref:Rho GTPase activation protein n=1 Tax=Cordyceps fumosorosea (strain ARSEF 2679) TaxID=1081104 RepID=A0A167Q0P1_CORFA|nr:Rho GTPase activation protein [Cordyceps fumosorosea ARSEF 2679]OAA57183.1 Rho GTPase activation protein [Cordyceps fumosorosea ARSEF 2679]
MASKGKTSQQPMSLSAPLLVLPESAFDKPLPGSSTFHSLLQNDRPLFSSHTWTSTSGDLGLLKDADEVEDRAIFVQEYNRLAKKHGLRPLILDDFDLNKPVSVVQLGLTTQIPNNNRMTTKNQRSDGFVACSRPAPGRRQSLEIATP